MMDSYDKEQKLVSHDGSQNLYLTHPMFIHEMNYYTMGLFKEKTPA